MTVVFAVLLAILGVAFAPLLCAAVTLAPIDDPAARPSFRQAVRASLPPSGRTWAVAAATGIGLAALGAAWGARLEVWPLLVLTGALVVVSFVDVDTFRIPDRITFPLAGLLVVGVGAVSLARGEQGWMVAALIGGLAYFGFLLLFWLVSPAGMGFGDVKLAFSLGMALGWVNLRLVMYGALVGALLGSAIGVAVTAVRRDRKAAFPFGPALCAGTWIVLVAWRWILS